MRVEESAYFADTLQGKTLIPSTGCVADAHVAAAAGIQASKLQHRHVLHYGQSGTATSVTIPIRIVSGLVGVLLSVKAGLIAACTGNATVTVDLKLNGTTVLTGVITLNSASTIRIGTDGVLASTALAVGDWLELVIVATAGTGALGTGLFVQVEQDETAQ